MERAGLRRQRELRGWSQEQAATKLADLIGEGTGTRPPQVAGNYFSRWERGVIDPSPFYVPWLCQLYGKTAEELGLVAEMMENVKRRQFLSSLTAAGGLMLLGQDLVSDPEVPR